MLLCGASEGAVAAALEEKKEWWAATFKEIKPWSPPMVAESRRAWIQVRGIPLHIWDEVFFKKICSLFGILIDFDEATARRMRLDVANLLISTKRLGRLMIVSMSKL